MVRSAVETLRNVALQVPLPNGPFNAVTIPGRSLETIAYLAMGACGWWRKKETTMSLLYIMKSLHAENELLSASSFDASTYLAFESDHIF